MVKALAQDKMWFILTQLHVEGLDHQFFPWRMFAAQSQQCAGLPKAGPPDQKKWLPIIFKV